MYLSLGIIERARVPKISSVIYMLPEWISEKNLPKTKTEKIKPKKIKIAVLSNQSENLNLLLPESSFMLPLCRIPYERFISFGSFLTQNIPSEIINNFLFA